jgi:hypothetical protein
MSGRTERNISRFQKLKKMPITFIGFSKAGAFRLAAVNINRAKIGDDSAWLYHTTP